MRYNFGNIFSSSVFLSLKDRFFFTTYSADSLSLPALNPFVTPSATTVSLGIWQMPSISQPGRYISVGVDPLDNTTVYLDRQSVRKTSKNSYRYMIFNSDGEMRFEEDLVVNCTQPRLVSHLGSHLYDLNGRLIKTDPAANSITPFEVSPPYGHIPYFNANREVCKLRL